MNIFYYTDPTGKQFAIQQADAQPVPLDSIGVMATLNAVLGVWSLSDAANAVGLTEQDLINEAQAWAVAGQL